MHERVPLVRNYVEVPTYLGAVRTHRWIYFRLWKLQRAIVFVESCQGAACAQDYGSRWKTSGLGHTAATISACKPDRVLCSLQQVTRGTHSGHITRTHQHHPLPTIQLSSQGRLHNTHSLRAHNLRANNLRANNPQPPTITGPQNDRALLGPWTRSPAAIEASHRF